MTVEEGKIEIERFNGTDFEYKKVEIEDILNGNDL